MTIKTDPTSSSLTLRELQLITKLQAMCRGKLSRMQGKKVLITQIASTILKYDPFSYASEEAKTNLLDLINTMSSNPERYRNKSLTPPYSLVSQLFLSVLWLEMSPYGKQIDLLTVPSKSPIETGARQVVYEARKFEIPLVVNNAHQREVRSIPRVMKKFNSLTRQGGVLSQDNFNIRLSVRNRGIEGHSRLQKRFEGNKEVKIASLPRCRFPCEPTQALASGSLGSQISPRSLETEQEWYNGSLGQFIFDGGVPEHLEPNPLMYPFNFTDCVSVILDVVNTLKWFTRSSLAHCDIKPMNILVSYKKGKAEGILIDFDTLQAFGNFKVGSLTSQAFQGYPFLDLLAKSNIITPLLDLHSSLISLMQCAFPSLTATCRCLTQPSVCNLSSKCLANSSYNMDLQFLINTGTSKLKPKERTAALKVFSLLTEIHEKIISTYEYLKKNPEIVKFLKGSPKEKRIALTKIEELLLTPEEILHYQKNQKDIEGFQLPFLYHIKILEALEVIKKELVS